MDEREREQHRLKFLADRTMQRREQIRRLSDRMIERRSVVFDRMDVIYQLLKAIDMPLTAKEIGQLLGLPRHLITGSGQPIELLEAEGKIGRIGPPKGRPRYYADPDLGPSLVQHVLKKHEH